MRVCDRVEYEQATGKRSHEDKGVVKRAWGQGVIERAGEERKQREKKAEFLMFVKY